MTAEHDLSDAAPFFSPAFSPELELHRSPEALEASGTLHGDEDMTTPYQVFERCMCGHYTLDCAFDETLTGCLTLRRLREHAEEVVTILSRRTTIFHLFVGKNKTKLTCHRALLCFYSNYFDTTLSGSFDESINLPECNAHAMKGFISWVYSGILDVEMHNLCKLWVLGDQLIAPRFANAVMFAFFSYFSVKNISADVAEEIYETTSPGSKLRMFCADIITAEGPFSGKFPHPLETEKWRTLIKKGGDLVLDQAETGSFKEVCPINHITTTAMPNTLMSWRKLI